MSGEKAKEVASHAFGIGVFPPESAFHGVVILAKIPWL